MSQTAPYTGLKFGWDPNTENFAAEMDANLQRIDAILQIGVVSKSLDVADIVPNQNDRYIVPNGGTGAFAGHDGQIAYWRSGTWYFIAPHHGFRAEVKQPLGSWAYVDGNGWQLRDVPEPGVGFEDAPMDGKRYYRKDGAWVEFVDTESFSEVVDITGSAYTLQPSDRGKVLNCTGACNITVPAGMPLRSVIYIRAATAAAVTLIEDTGVEIDTKFSLTLNGEKALASLLFLFADNPTLTGDIA